MHEVMRRGLYELVWSKPMKEVARQFGVSDVALAKKCRGTHIRVPERGFWAKKKAGIQPAVPLLPDRPPGFSDWVRVGRYGVDNSRESLDAIANEPIPSPPQFEGDIQSVRKIANQMVGRVTVSIGFQRCHRDIRRLLDEDEQRKDSQDKPIYAHGYYGPIFESVIARRRLRIINGLFLTLCNAKCVPYIRGHDALEIGVGVGDQVFHLKLDVVKDKHQRQNINEHEANKKPPRLRLDIVEPLNPEGLIATWEDKGPVKLEARLHDIATELIVYGEHQYRELAKRHHQWQVEHTAYVESERRKEAEERERAEREHRKKIAKDRLNRLIVEAKSLSRAEEIRRYVVAVRDAVVSGSYEMEPLQLESWAAWALNQADHVDPLKTGGVHFHDSGGGLADTR